jgi:signal transduction histidine kinase
VIKNWGNWKSLGRAECAMDDPILPGEIRKKIVSDFERCLRAQGTTAFDSSAVHRLMLDQRRTLSDDVVDGCQVVAEDTGLGAGALRAEIGDHRGTVGTHLATTLCLACVLFEAALSLMLRVFSALARSDAVLLIHRAIMRRIGSYTAPYAGFIPWTIRASHRAERARLARELHDRTAHSIGVGIQNLELYEVHSSGDTVQAQEKLDRAREAMGQALESVRDFIGELRRTVRPDELEHALTEYLVTNADSGVLTNVEVVGDPSMLPPDVCEELYFTLREAIRNALVHSGADRLDVTLAIGESELHARVSDTGRGFSAEKAKEAGAGIGLSTMQERVQLLGGTLRLSSALGHGATVDISIPLGPVPT